MAMRIETETPGVCKNKDCPDYQAFEMYDLEDIQEPRGEEYVICRGCGERIMLE